MITSWIDLLGAALLGFAGLFHLERGQLRRRLSKRSWLGDPAALVISLLGSMLLGMGLLLLLYSVAFAWLSEPALRR